MSHADSKGVTPGLPDQHLTLTSASEARTRAIGRRLGERLTYGACICITGSLGAGKSVFVRGVCRGLGVDESVISPSFILCEEYRGRLPVLHNDFYRLDHESDIEELGVFDRIDGTTVVLAEWGDRSERMMREADIIVNLVVSGEETRTITLYYRGDDRDIVADLEQQ